MEKISKKAVDAVLTSTSRPAVSIYIPMHTTVSPPHISENQIRFKNLLLQAVHELEKMQQSAATKSIATQLKDEISRRANDLAFWESQTPGLLLCVNQEFFKTFSLPVDTEEYVAVDEQFHLAPVLAILEDNREYYVLALAQHQPRLFKGDSYSLHSTKIALPHDLETGLGIDENNQKGENQGSARGPSGDTAWFNGRGGARNPQEADRLKFFRMIDEAITRQTDTSLPLLIAGIDAEVAEFKNVSHHSKLLRGHISGNHTTTQLHDLFPKVTEIIRAELIEPVHAAAADEYSRLKGANPDRVASDQDRLMDAAKQGRVDKLLGSMYRLTTDTVRDTLSAVTQLTFPASKQASRQLNRAAFHVWTTSGHIISLQPEQIPSSKPMVARLRY